MPDIRLNLPDDPYTITIEPGALERLGASVRAVAPHARALLAVDSAIEETHAPVAKRSLREAGYEVVTTSLVAVEAEKTIETVSHLHDVMLAGRLERRSPVVALGGGLVGDVAGFAAATYLRGVPLVQVPTTLLAMVDASIGGKTGVNHPLPGGQVGKNLVGAFWQPRAVIADPLVLRTLDDRHLRCGLAECVKHALIADLGLLDAIEAGLESIMARDPDVLTALVARSAAVKCAIVTNDVTEQGERALLNLGHTFAHAIEPLESLDLQHGEAVAIGLSAAAWCSNRTGRLTETARVRIDRLLDRIGLPRRLASPVPVETLLDAMRYDKKVGDDKLRLILPVESGAVIVDDVPPAIVRETWGVVGAETRDEAFPA